MNIDMPKAEVMIRDEFTIPKTEELCITPASSHERVTEILMGAYGGGRWREILEIAFINLGHQDQRPTQLFEAFCEWFDENKTRIAAECPAEVTE